MSTALAPRNGASTALTAIDKLFATGDLGQLSTADRVDYYNSLCQSLGLNPLSRPFEFITLKGKLTLYARKDCTDQLRKLNGVSIERPEIQEVGGLIVVSVTARDRSGRYDSDCGVVHKSDMQGDIANATMKAVTKAKRRVTLSLCGLGFLDESEVEPAQSNPVEVHHREPGQTKSQALAESIRGPKPAASLPAPADDQVDDGHAAVNASYPPPARETTARKPAKDPRQRWEDFLDKLMDRWHKAEPMSGDQDLTSRQHRLAHGLVSRAIADGRVAESAISRTNKEGKTVRDPGKVWEAVHTLCEVDFPWVKENALAYLKEKLDALPKEAPRRERPAPLAEVPPVPPTGQPGFDECDDDEPRPIREREPGED